MRVVAPYILLALLAAALFATNITGYDLWPPDEPRFAEVAREMLVLDDWLVPHVNGEPYYEKPPLLFWLAALASVPGGEVTEWTARIPSIMAGLLTLLFTGLLARSLAGPRVAFWAVLILMTNARVWWQARTGQIDMLLTACMMLSLLAFWYWDQRRQGRWLVLFYLGIALGLLAKGPPALVFPLALAMAYYWGQPAQRRRLHLVWGTLAAAVPVLLWYIPARLAAEGDAAAAVETGIAGNLFRNTIGRIFLGVSKAQWPGYYLLETIPVDLMPWTLFLPWLFVWLWQRGRADNPTPVRGLALRARGQALAVGYSRLCTDPAMRLLLSWTVPALVFFSLSIGKRAIYILPLFPVFAILLAMAITGLADSPRAVWRRRIALAWGVVLLILAVAPFALFATEYAGVWNRGLLAFSLCALAFGLDALRRGRQSDALLVHGLVGSHMAGLALMSAIFVLPVVNEFKSAKAICTPVRTLAEAGEDLHLYSIGFSREEYIFYSKHFHTPVLTDLLPVERKVPASLLEDVADQKEIREAIAEAVEDIHVASFEHLTDAELAALRDAVHSVDHVQDVDDAVTAAFERALENELAKFNTAFNSPTPAFAYVQVEDWKWILPFHPAFRAYRVLESQSVGSRDVLLLANAAGAERLGLIEPVR